MDISRGQRPRLRCKSNFVAERRRKTAAFAMKLGGRYLADYGATRSRHNFLAQIQWEFSVTPCSPNPSIVG
jgi:hypothetical protein